MKKDSLRAILFDFDGVIADSEPLHLQMFQKVLKEEGVILTREDYYNKYLGLDDRGCFAQVYKDAGKVLQATKIEEMLTRKNRALLETVKGQSLLLPGIPELIAQVRDRYYLTIVSGALKSEILAILEGEGLTKAFHTIVAANDISQGKPHPEGFEAAIRILNRDFVPPAEILLPGECLAIEDSPWGIEAAKAAKVKCLAVTTSYDASRLTGADLIAKDPASIPWEKVEALFSQ
jgi:HAD superfamily hydrolase (TIGR01509 family)